MIDALIRADTMATPLPELFAPDPGKIHTGSEIVAKNPLEVMTPAAQWSYAVTKKSRGAIPRDDSARVAITVNVLVRSGRIGVGWIPRRVRTTCSSAMSMKGASDRWCCEFPRPTCRVA
jgi:hypothetical protein